MQQLRKFSIFACHFYRCNMFDVNNEVIPWIGKTAKMLDYYHSRVLQQNGFDLTKGQWVLLKILSKRNGISQNEVACITERNKTSLTRLVNTMEKKNLIARIPSAEDKRINLIYVTIHGKKILDDTQDIVRDLFIELNEGLTSKEISTVINALRKIQNNIKDTNGC